MSQRIKFNLSCIEFALKNNLHVEYFIQSYLKSIDSSGIYNVNDIRINYDNKKKYLKHLRNYFFKKTLVLFEDAERNLAQNEICAQNITTTLIKNNIFKASTFEKHLLTNVFYEFKNEKIYIKNNKKNSIESSSFSFICNFYDASFMAQKEATHSKNILEGWNSTLIKYFFIAIYACKYGNSRPYALDLISEDLSISVSTIQKAIKVFEVKKSFKSQEKNTLRSYTESGKRINLSPNYMSMSFGKFSANKKILV